ncbi:MAG: hypothetical protein ACRET7_01835 [Burkholderiales bacterium]
MGMELDETWKDGRVAEVYLTIRVAAQLGRGANGFDLVPGYQDSSIVSTFVAIKHTGGEQQNALTIVRLCGTIPRPRTYRAGAQGGEKHGKGGKR